MIVLVESLEMELPESLETRSGKEIHRSDSLILAAEHIVAVNIHSLICKARLAAVLTLKGPEMLNFRLRPEAGADYDTTDKQKDFFHSLEYVCPTKIRHLLRKIFLEYYVYRDNLTKG